MPHPYKHLEGTELWKALNRGIDDLIENKHLEETTPREYIVGHLYLSITTIRDAGFCSDCY